MALRSLVSVVDDDESVRESLPDLLRQFGFAVEAFSSAEEFLASDCVSRTRCLILDIAMPGMSGPDLQQQLRVRQQEIPIVLSRPTRMKRSVQKCSQVAPWSACSSHSARRLCFKPLAPHCKRAE
jgi:FixJ family two-component response regulator